MKTRRQFIKVAGTGALAVGANSLYSLPSMPMSADST